MENVELAKALIVLSQHEGFNEKLEELNKMIEQAWRESGSEDVYKLGRKIMFILKEMNR